MTKELTQAEEILDRAIGLWLDEGCDIAEHIAEALAAKNKAIDELEGVLCGESECAECDGSGADPDTDEPGGCSLCDGTGHVFSTAAAKRLVTEIKARARWQRRTNDKSGF